MVILPSPLHCLRLELLLTCVWFSSSSCREIVGWTTYTVQNNIDISFIDSTLIFRKSSVRSKIECLNDCLKSQPDCQSVYYLSIAKLKGSCYQLRNSNLSTITEVSRYKGSYMWIAENTSAAATPGITEVPTTSTTALPTTTTTEVPATTTTEVPTTTTTEVLTTTTTAKPTTTTTEPTTTTTEVPTTTTTEVPTTTTTEVPTTASISDSACTGNEFQNVQQFWAPIAEDDSTSGVLLQATYSKSSSTTGLRVALDMSVRGSNDETDKCSRWYFKFNDVICSNPGTIEYIVYTLKEISNKHKSINMDGVCYGLPSGDIKVEVAVEACGGKSAAAVYTGYKTGKTLVVMEVPSQESNDAAPVAGASVCSTDVAFNYKYYTWQEEINDEVDQSVNGLSIKDISYYKKADNTAIRVKYNAAFGIYMSKNKDYCAQWKIKVGGEDCSPIPADTMIEISNPGRQTFWEHFVEVNSLEAICTNNLLAGEHSIQISVGLCESTGIAEAGTRAHMGGFSSPSRLHVDEVVLNTAADTITGSNGLTYTSTTSSIAHWGETTFSCISSNDVDFILVKAYTKQFADTALRITVSGVFKTDIPNNKETCVRWYVAIDGSDCTDPGPIESIMYMAIHTNYFSPMQINGICNGVSAGNHNLNFNLGFCDGSSEIRGTMYTGDEVSFHIFAEELRLSKVTTCSSGTPVNCGS